MSEPVLVWSDRLPDESANWTKTWSLFKSKSVNFAGIDDLIKGQISQLPGEALDAAMKKAGLRLLFPGHVPSTVDVPTFNEIVDWGSDKADQAYQY